jgi:hypothetical protein
MNSIARCCLMVLAGLGIATLPACYYDDYPYGSVYYDDYDYGYAPSYHAIGYRAYDYGRYHDHRHYRGHRHSDDNEELKLVRYNERDRGRLPEGYHSKEWYKARGISVKQNTLRDRSGELHGREPSKRDGGDRSRSRGDGDKKGSHGDGDKKGSRGKKD